MQICTSEASGTGSITAETACTFLCLMARKLLGVTRVNLDAFRARDGAFDPSFLDSSTDAVPKKQESLWTFEIGRRLKSEFEKLAYLCIFILEIRCV